MLNLKTLRTQAKALGIKGYYKMNKQQLEYSLLFKFHFNNHAAFVPCENVDDFISGFLGTFSFNFFNDNGKLSNTVFTLRKKDLRSASSEGINVTDNHVRYFGESYIEFYDSQNETVLDYFPYIDIIQFRLAWQQKYQQDNSVINDFACEYTLRDVLNEILRFAGYLDNKDNFIHDGNCAFRIHAWNYFKQNKHNTLEKFIMPDVLFSDENDIDNPLTWIKDNHARNDALRAYIRLLYTEHTAQLIKEYYSNDESIFDSFIQDLHDTIRELHFVYSDIAKTKGMTYKKAIQAIFDILSQNYECLNNPFSIHYENPKIKNEIANILRKCTDATINKIACNNTVPLILVDYRGERNSFPRREREINSLASELVMIAFGIANGRIDEKSILQSITSIKRAESGLSS